MKTTKRLLSCLLVLAMLFALAIPAFADGDGTITITNATVGQDYKAYKIFDATYAGNPDTTPAEGVAYTIKSTDKWYTMVSAKGSPYTLEETAVNGTFNVTSKATPEQLSAWFNTEAVKTFIADLTADASTPDGGATSATVKLTVPYGYYVVTSSLGNANVSVNSAAPAVSIIDKNQKPGGGDNTKNYKKIVMTDTDNEAVEVDKVFSAQIGDTIAYEISYTVTNYNGTELVTSYTVQDELPAGLTLVENSIKVTVTPDKEGAAATTIADPNIVKVGQTFSVTVNRWNEGNYASPSILKVTYQVTVGSTAAMNVPMTNKAKLLVNGKDVENSEKTETVYTFAAAIQKMDSKGTGLPGAEFTITTADGAPVNVTEKIAGSGVYVVSKTSTSNKVVSPASGLIVIKGLKDIDYKMVETKAPNGYNMTDKALDVHPTQTSATKTTYHIDAEGKVVDVDGVKTVTTTDKVVPYAVINNKGTVLPSTGGIGTTMFYVIGGLMVAAAVVVLVSKKRMGAEQ